jgi:predicted lipoprotein with Yx(FWY)xxD motif
MKLQVGAQLVVIAAIWTGLAYGDAPTPPPPLTKVVAVSEAQLRLGDSMGKILYVFDVDQGKPLPACNGGCAEIWPPYLLTDSEVTQLKNPFASIKRQSQQQQLTFNGRPVYTYIFDRVSGDVLGDGLGGVWHVINQ